MTLSATNRRRRVSNLRDGISLNPIAFEQGSTAFTATCLKVNLMLWL
jgi:hypothetical protein